MTNLGVRPGLLLTHDCYTSTYESLRIQTLIKRKEKMQSLGSNGAGRAPCRTV